MSYSRLPGSGTLVRVFVISVISPLTFIFTSPSSFTRLCGCNLWRVHGTRARHGRDSGADLGDLRGQEDLVRLLEHVPVGGGGEGHGAYVGPHGQGELETPEAVHGFGTTTTFEFPRFVTNVGDEGLSQLTRQAHQYALQRLFEVVLTIGGRGSGGVLP